MLIYGICFTLGGVFVLLSALGGLDGMDLDSDFDSDLDFTLHDVDAGTHAGQAPDPSNRIFTRPRRRLWLPFFSLRFWTFGLCFLGLTGLLLTLLQPGLGALTIALIALSMGLVCGTGAAVILRSLGSETVSSLIQPEEIAGQIGIVEIPFDADSRGKVRLSLKGSTLAFSARTEEARAFQRGERVLVVGLENGRLWIVGMERAE